MNHLVHLNAIVTWVCRKRWGYRSRFIPRTFHERLARVGPRLSSPLLSIRLALVRAPYISMYS
jgi:hypothetical protein